MSRQHPPRPAPTEPDFHVPGAPEIDAATDQSWNDDAGYDIPAPETDLPHQPQDAAHSTATAATETSHPLLTAMDATTGRLSPWQALLAWKELAQRAAAVQEPSIEEHAVWLGATRRWVETAVAIGQEDVAAALLQREVLPRFQTASWQRYQQLAGRHFRRIIRLHLREGKPQEALAVFQQAHRVLVLEPEDRRNLAEAASQLERTDVAAARLYLDCLEHGEAAATDAERYMALLRQAIRISLEEPDEHQLLERLQLNDRLWQLRARPWAAAHQAVAAVRRRDYQRAWTFCRTESDAHGADTDACLLLATAAYSCQQYDTALQFLQRAADDTTSSPVVIYYLALARLARDLSGQTSAASQEELLRQLEADVSALDSPPVNAAGQMDAAWQRGTALYLLGRDHEALEAFRTAPLDQLTLRHSLWEVETMIRAGLAQHIPARLQQIEAAVPQAARIVRLLQAREALDHFDLQQARSLTSSAQHAEDINHPFDNDCAAVQDCLEEEFAQLSSRGDRPRPIIDAQRSVSAVVGAWRDRLLARWHLERGEMQQAEQLLSAPRQWVAPPREWWRLEAARLALLGMNEEVAGNIFEHLATSPAARPIDHLQWGLWLCGRNEHERAAEVLEPLTAQLDHCLELRLARAEAAIAQDQPQRAFEILHPVEAAELPFWVTPPRVAVYRPWQRRLPMTLWSFSASRSMHRVADMLHAASLLVRCARVDEAMQLLHAIEELLGDERAVVYPQLARVVRQACLHELEQGRLEQACALHTEAGRLQDVDPNFAVQMAEATADWELTPPDAVLQVFCDWLPVAAANSIDENPVAAALRRFLFVDDVAPESHVELQRRATWTRRAAAARPDWDWPHRNLARCACRDGQHEETLEHIERISQPTDEDHWLAGRAAWLLGRYTAALAALTAARDSGREDPQTRALWGCSRAAVELEKVAATQSPLAQVELTQLLAQLPDPLGEPQLLGLVRLHRAAVLLAAGQHEPAIELLDGLALQPEWQSPARILLGFALLRAARREQAAAVWQHDEQEGPLLGDPLQQSLLCLHGLLETDASQRPRWRRAIQQLRKRQPDVAAFHIAAGHIALWDGDLEHARACLVAARAAPSLAVLLAPLSPTLGAETALLSARCALHLGQGEAAAQEIAPLLNKQTTPAFIPRTARLLEVNIHIVAGRWDEGRRLLESLNQQEPQFWDARAQLALLLVRQSQPQSARQHLKPLLDAAPGHPLALLALAEIREAEGQLDEAAQTYQTLTTQHSAAAGPRVAAAALLALGRLRLLANRHDEARACLQQALDMRPEWPQAERPLAIVLATSQKPEHQQQADALLAKLSVSAGDNAALQLAAACSAQRQHNEALAADCLAHAVASSDFTRLSDAYQRSVHQWRLQLLLRLRRFGAAIEAAQPLVSAGEVSDAEVRRWHELQAISLLQQTPLTSCELEQALSAAESARDQRDRHPLPLLLSVLCRVLLGQAHAPETRRLTETLSQAVVKDRQHQVLAAITRYLAGDESALQQATALTQAVSGEALPPTLQLLIANQSRSPAALAAYGRDLARGKLVAGPQDPLAADDLVALAALDALGSGGEPEAADLLRQWHGRGASGPWTRTLYSQLLARQAVKHLRDTELGLARNLLFDAVQILKPTAPMESTDAVLSKSANTSHQPYPDLAQQTSI